MRDNRYVMARARAAIQCLTPIAIVACLSFLIASPANAQSAADACLACHEDKTLSMTMKDGSTMSLFVDRAEVAKSVHGSQLICTDCHTKYDKDHPSGATFDSSATRP